MRQRKNMSMTNFQLQPPTLSQDWLVISTWVNSPQENHNRLAISTWVRCQAAFVECFHGIGRCCQMTLRDVQIVCRGSTSLQLFYTFLHSCCWLTHSFGCISAWWILKRAWEFRSWFCWGSTKISYFIITQLFMVSNLFSMILNVIFNYTFVFFTPWTVKQIILRTHFHFIKDLAWLNWFSRTRGMFAQLLLESCQLKAGWAQMICHHPNNCSWGAMRIRLTATKCAEGIGLNATLLTMEYTRGRLLTRLKKRVTKSPQSKWKIVLFNLTK